MSAGPPKKKYKLGGKAFNLTESKLKKVANSTIKEDSSIGSMQNPLMNYVVLSNLFEFMNGRDLKDCRLVSKTWAYVATPFLERRSQVFVHCGRFTFRCSRTKTKPLKEFQQCVNPDRRTIKTFINFRHFHIVNFDLSLTSQEVLFERCGKFLTSLHLDQINEQDCNYLMTCIYHKLRNLKELSIICNEQLDRSNTKQVLVTDSIPEENPQPLKLQRFSLVATDEETEPSFDWKTFYKLSPHIEELELKASFNGLCSALENYNNLHISQQNDGIRRIIISLEKDDFVYGSHLDRDRLSQLLKAFISVRQCEELIIDVNLSAPQWKTIFSTMPSTLKILSLSSDWCLGDWYPENKDNQPKTEGSLDYFLSTIGKCQNLTELIMYVHAGKVGTKGAKRVRMMNCNHIFPNITFLTWIYTWKYRWSWQNVCPQFFKTLPTIFPNLIHLETTVHSKRSFRELLTSLPNLEKLIISQKSNYKIQDLDLVGNGWSQQEGSSENRGRNKKQVYLGILNLKKLKSLNLEADSSELTDTSIYHGFLLLPELKELAIYQAANPMKFGPEAVNALHEKLKCLTVVPSPPQHPY